MEPLTPEQTQERFQLLLEKAKRGIVLSIGDTEFLHRHKDKERWKKNLSEVAAVFNVYVSAMMRWKEINPDAFQKTPLGYDLDAIKSVRKQFLADGSYTRLNDGDDVNVEGVEDVATLKARKIHLECQKLATQIEILQAKYVSVDEVLAQVRAVMYAIKEKIKRIPPEMAYEVSGVSPAEAEERLFTCIDKILREMGQEDYIKIEEQLKAKKVDVEMMEVEIAPTEPIKRGRPRKS
jgi:hypothetical protein